MEMGDHRQLCQRLLKCMTDRWQKEEKTKDRESLVRLLFDLFLFLNLFLTANNIQKGPPITIMDCRFVQ